MEENLNGKISLIEILEDLFLDFFSLSSCNNRPSGTIFFKTLTEFIDNEKFFDYICICIFGGCFFIYLIIK